jgi:phosphoglucomutase
MSYLTEFEKWKKATKSKELTEIEGNDNEIKERFYTALAFGTAGMRGVVGLGRYRNSKS